MTPEERKRKYGKNGIKNGMYGKTHTDEVKQKLSEINKNKKGTFTGKTHTKETREKLSNHAKNKTGDKNPFYGKTHTKEAKEKMSKYHSGKTPVNCRKVKIHDDIYNSLTEAGRTLNVSTATIVYRLKSPNYDYNYL